MLPYGLRVWAAHECLGHTHALFIKSWTGFETVTAVQRNCVRECIMKIVDPMNGEVRVAGRYREVHNWPNAPPHYVSFTVTKVTPKRTDINIHSIQLYQGHSVLVQFPPQPPETGTGPPPGGSMPAAETEERGGAGAPLSISFSELKELDNESLRVPPSHIVRAAAAATAAAAQPPRRTTTTTTKSKSMARAPLSISPSELQHLDSESLRLPPRHIVRPVATRDGSNRDRGTELFFGIIPKPKTPNGAVAPKQPSAPSSSRPEEEEVHGKPIKKKRMADALEGSPTVHESARSLRLRRRLAAMAMQRR